MDEMYSSDDSKSNGSKSNDSKSYSSRGSKAVSRASRNSLVVTDDDERLVMSNTYRPTNNVSGASVCHALFPYRHSIFLFLLSYSFCLFLIHDHIQNERLLDELVVHVRRHTIPWNGTSEEERRPPFYLDLNVLVSGSNKLRNHDEMEEHVQLLTKMDFSVVGLEVCTEI
mgnify:CR=1 FL=1